MNPFRIDGPAVIAFSGGRTSGYMLHEILRAHQWILPDDVVPVFCNTGKEHEATLDFVQACATHWNVRIRWVEYRRAAVPFDRWREVDHATASRSGEPFEAVILDQNYLPNPVTRYCTSEMKIKASMRFARVVLGFDGDHYRAVGLRADEQHRVARGRTRYESGKDGKGGEPIYPLHAAGRVKADISAFWKRQPFDLGLPNIDGTTPMGNCDLCFLKGAGKIASIIAAEPARAVWWARMETLITSRNFTPIDYLYADGDDDETGDPIACVPARNGRNRGRFRHDRPGYAQMLSQGNLLLHDDSPDTIDCACTD